MDTNYTTRSQEAISGAMQAAASAPAPEQPVSTGQDEDIVDAEIVDDEDSK